MTSETLDFESEYIFESHEHSQSTTDIMPVLTSFIMDQIGYIIRIQLTPRPKQVHAVQTTNQNFEIVDLKYRKDQNT